MYKPDLAAHFVDPSHPIAFTSPGAVKRFFGKKYSGKDILATLRNIDGYTLHKEYKKPNVRNPYYVYSRREQVQMDLIDVRKLAQYNDDKNWLLVAIDVFSKFSFVEAMSRKNSNETVKALTAIFSRMNPLPRMCFMDYGEQKKKKNIN